MHRFIAFSRQLITCCMRVSPPPIPHCRMGDWTRVFFYLSLKLKRQSAFNDTIRLVTAGIWLTRLINPSQHSNLKSALTQIPQLAMVKTNQKDNYVIRQDMHDLISQFWNNCKRHVLLTEMRSRCHHKPVPQDRGRGRIFLHGQMHSRCRSRMSKRTRLGHGWPESYVSKGSSTLKVSLPYTLSVGR